MHHAEGPPMCAYIKVILYTEGDVFQRAVSGLRNLIMTDKGPQIVCGRGH